MYFTDCSNVVSRKRQCLQHYIRDIRWYPLALSEMDQKGQVQELHGATESMQDFIITSQKLSLVM